MSSAINPTTHDFSIPYITVAEYKNAPTAIDIDNLVYDSTDPDVQDSELANVIARASSWCDTEVNQILGATNDTEAMRSRVKSDGTIRFHPRFNPIIALTSFSFGYYPTQMSTFTDVSGVWIEDYEFIVPYANNALNWTSQGPIGFGGSGAAGSEVFLKFSYVNGYANDLIAIADIGETSLTVLSGVGIVPGLRMKIYDGMYSEDVQVADDYIFGSTTVPLTRPLLYDHAPGISISALPPAVKQAAILATTAFLKIRGDNSMTMQVGTTPSSSNADFQNLSSDFGVAKELLMPYRRIR